MSDIVDRLRSADVLIVKSATDLRSAVAEEAAAEIEKLRAALQTARRNALEEAARAVEMVAEWGGQDYYCESCKGGVIYPDRNEVATTIRALGEKE
jgi:uncharacterized membrane protein YccC